MESDIIVQIVLVYSDNQLSQSIVLEQQLEHIPHTLRLRTLNNSNTNVSKKK